MNLITSSAESIHASNDSAWTHSDQIAAANIQQYNDREPLPERLGCGTLGFGSTYTWDCTSIRALITISLVIGPTSSCDDDKSSIVIGTATQWTLIAATAMTFATTVSSRERRIWQNC